MVQSTSLVIVLVVIVQILIAIALTGCPDQIEDFNNPIDPQNPNSPFATPIVPADNTWGTFSIFPGQSSLGINFAWEPIPHATRYHFQLADDISFSDESLIRDAYPGAPAAGTIPLETDHPYYWRVCYETRVDFGSGTEQAWGPWHSYSIFFTDDGDNLPAGDGYGAFAATGVIRGTPVEVDGMVTFGLPDPGDQIYFELTSIDPASEGRIVGLGLNPMGTEVGTYTMPSLGQQGIDMWLGSDLIEESEGYFGNLVVEPSTFTITADASEQVAGQFDITTNIGDTLTGSFDFTVPGYEPYSFPDNIPYGGPIHTTTITIDGDPSDWTDVTSRIIEHTGDSSFVGTGGDISRVSVAADAANIYFMMELADDTPSVTGEFDYRFWIQDNDPSDWLGNIEIGMGYNGSSWDAYGFEWDGATWQTIPSIDNTYGAVGTVIEMKLPRSLISLPQPWVYRGHLQRNTLTDDPDGTEFWLFTF